MNTEEHVFLTAEKVNMLKNFVEYDTLFIEALNIEIRKYEQTNDLLGAVLMRLKETDEDFEIQKVYQDTLEDVSVRLNLLGKLEKLYRQDHEVDKELLKSTGINLDD